MASTKFATVEDYLNSLDPVKAQTIRAIFTYILSEYPELEMKLAWNVPQIHRQGKYVAGIAAFKDHLTFAPWSEQVMVEFAGRLKGYTVSKGSFQIPVDWNIDTELIKGLVRARLAELDREPQKGK